MPLMRIEGPVAACHYTGYPFGATYVYEHLVRPMFVNPKTVNIWYVPSGKKNIFSKQDDILAAAERCIEENGTQAFEKLISRWTEPLQGSFGETSQSELAAFILHNFSGQIGNVLQQDLKRFEDVNELHSKEIVDASREMEDNLTIYVRALEMCQSVKKLVQFLKVASSLMLRDDMKISTLLSMVIAYMNLTRELIAWIYVCPSYVDEESQGIHRSTQ